MVVPLVRPTVTHENDTFAQTQGAQTQARPEAITSTRSRMVCPRCEAPLWITYEEPECLQCGYVDYQYTAPNSGVGEKSIISSATRYIIRYVGAFPALTDLTAHVHVERVRNFVVHGVKCPFCDKQMVRSSVSGNRKGVREGRYRCDEGHRLSLTPDKGGGLGWK